MFVLFVLFVLFVFFLRYFFVLKNYFVFSGSGEKNSGSLSVFCEISVVGLKNVTVVPTVFINS